MKLEEILIEEKADIRTAVEQLERVRCKVIYVTAGGKLIASISDGDIRRYALHEGDVNLQVKYIANYNPTFLIQYEKEKIEEIFTCSEVPTSPALFNLLCLDREIRSVNGDIRDLSRLKTLFGEVKPEIVIHMAAQPLVRQSYQNPVYTCEVNAMGTVNVLECTRKTDSVKSFLNVTTDKVYINKEWQWGYRENDELNGYDPYSNSKSCSELITDSYKKSFFGDRETAISTARAGNVIGGGDFATDRIVPDCVRAVCSGNEVVVRNPYSTRPYQHVLDPVMAYLLISQNQYENKKQYEGSYNVGPDETDCYTTGGLVTLFCDKWEAATGEKALWRVEGDDGPHEANFLKLDCSKLKSTMNWKPTWNLDITMEKVAQWYACYKNKQDLVLCTENQIHDFWGF